MFSGSVASFLAVIRPTSFPIVFYIVRIKVSMQSAAGFFLGFGTGFKKLYSVVEAGYNKVGYRDVPDIAKGSFGTGQNPLCHEIFVGYSEVGYNVIPLIVKQFFDPS